MLSIEIDVLEQQQFVRENRELFADIDDDLLEFFDFSEVIYTYRKKHKRNYKDFNAMLEVESNQDTRELINLFYSQVWNAGSAILDYDNSQSERYLQIKGVDVILTKDNNKYYVQEKITRKRYDSLMFEYRKSSGKAGWAVDENELADILIYYQPNRVFIFSMRAVRNYVIKKLEDDIDVRYLTTDNENILISIKELKNNVKIIEYEFNTDEKAWKRK
ncbi:hypothetical protein ACFW0C_09645 [Aerococcus sp. NPDC058936]|uniref:hypothetical protein n=1 Tax=Aerococcus sp. NPDC058936 TaxID=3346674 RepID=UPI0036709876